MNAPQILSLDSASRIDDDIDACKYATPPRSVRGPCQIERDVMRIRRRRLTRHQYTFMPFGGEPSVDCRSNKARAANEKDT